MRLSSLTEGDGGSVLSCRQLCQTRSTSRFSANSLSVSVELQNQYKCVSGADIHLLTYDAIFDSLEQKCVSGGFEMKPLIVQVKMVDGNDCFFKALCNETFYVEK